MGVTRAVMELKNKGIAPRQIRHIIDNDYAGQMEGVTPTPYPPA